MTTLAPARSPVTTARERLEAGALIGTVDLAILLDVSPESISRMIRRGCLVEPDIGRGKGQRWRASTIKKFLEGPRRRGGA